MHSLQPRAARKRGGSPCSGFALSTRSRGDSTLLLSAPFSLHRWPPSPASPRSPSPPGRPQSRKHEKVDADAGHITSVEAGYQDCRALPRRLLEDRPIVCHPIHISARHSSVAVVRAPWPWQPARRSPFNLFCFSLFSFRSRVVHGLRESDLSFFSLIYFLSLFLPIWILFTVWGNQVHV